MSRDVMDKVLRRLIVVYGEPKDVEPKELFAEFFKALGSYRGDILSKATDLVIRERAFPGWPTVGEVVKACREVSDEMADRHIEQPSPVYDKPPVTPEVAKRLLGQATQFLDPMRSFPNIMASARKWARDHNCKVTVDVSENPPMWDEHGSVIPFGYGLRKVPAE